MKTYPHKNLHTNIHNTIVHKSSKVETAHLLIADEPIKKCGKVGPMFLLVSHLWSQPTADGKYIGKKFQKRTFLVTQWLRLCAPDAGGPSSIPGQGTIFHMPLKNKILHVSTKPGHSQKKDPESSKMQNFTITIYITFTLYLQLFT